MKQTVLPLARTTSIPASTRVRTASTAAVLIRRRRSVMVPSTSVTSAFNTA
jgi:hypothetical protein